VPHSIVYFSVKRKRQAGIHFSGDQHNSINAFKDDLSSWKSLADQPSNGPANGQEWKSLIVAHCSTHPTHTSISHKPQKCGYADPLRNYSW